MPTEFRPARRTFLALVLALAAFVVYFGESSRTTVNGVVTSQHDYNYAAVILGAIALLLVAGEAYRLFWGDRRAAGPLALHGLFLVTIAAIAIFQVLDGADML